jgi:acyl dehydratase
MASVEQVPTRRPLDPARLLAWPIDEVEQAWTARDAAFYALALGIPSDPLQATSDLAYAYEGLSGGQRVLPTLACVLADPGFWLRDPRLGLDWPRMLHAGQSITWHRPLAVQGCVRSRSRVIDVRDGGRERGTWVVTRRALYDTADDSLVCTLDQTSLLRGDGGFAGADPSSRNAPGSKATQREGAPRNAGAAAAEGAAEDAQPPDATHLHRTPAQAALMYRLCADMNPLHADPRVAAEAGYAQPILHGMATLGVACHGLLTALELAPEALERLDARFTAPVFPGEALQTRVWRGGENVRFELWQPERAVVVLRGTAQARAPTQD